MHLNGPVLCIRLQLKRGKETCSKSQDTNSFFMGFYYDQSSNVSFLLKINALFIFQNFLSFEKTVIYMCFYIRITATDGQSGKQQRVVVAQYGNKSRVRSLTDRDRLLLFVSKQIVCDMFSVVKGNCHRSESALHVQSVEVLLFVLDVSESSHVDQDYEYSCHLMQTTSL